MPKELNKPLRWFRVHADIINNSKILLIAPSDRWYFIGLMSLKSLGVLDKYSGEKLDRVVMRHLELTQTELAETMRRLQEEDLIDENYQPIKWDQRQFKSDSSTERVKKHRMKRFSNVSVTPPETETETETETYKTIKITSSSAKNDPVPMAKIVDLYHQKLPQLPSVQKMTSARQASIRQRWKSGDLPALENWENFFDYISQSDFLMGKAPASSGRKPFVASLEWVCKESNYTKILEGNYHGV